MSRYNDIKIQKIIMEQTSILNNNMSQVVTHHTNYYEGFSYNSKYLLAQTRGTEIKRKDIYI